MLNVYSVTWPPDLVNVSEYNNLSKRTATGQKTLITSVLHLFEILQLLIALTLLTGRFSYLTKTFQWERKSEQRMHYCLVVLLMSLTCRSKCVAWRGRCVHCIFGKMHKAGSLSVNGCECSKRQRSRATKDLVNFLVSKTTEMPFEELHNTDIHCAPRTWASTSLSQGTALEFLTMVTFD